VGGGGGVLGAPPGLSLFPPTRFPSARLGVRDDREQGPCTKGTLEEEAGQPRRVVLAPRRPRFLSPAPSRPQAGLRGGQVALL